MKDVRSNLELKEDAAKRSLKYIKNFTSIGLGTGSTTAIAIRKLAEKIKRENLNIRVCTTSYQSFLIAKEEGLDVFPVEYFSELDLTIDGADEVDPEFRLIKGGGAAHTLEKIVHSMSKHFICIIDPSKLVQNLGEKFYVPIEVIPSSVNFVIKELKNLKPRDIKLRISDRKDGPVITDNGNFVIDVKFENFSPEDLELTLNYIPGIVENGIFAKVKPHVVIIGGGEEKIRS